MTTKTTGPAKAPSEALLLEIAAKHLHILHLRRDYYLGPIRIVWYLERYHGLKISDAGVYPSASRRLRNNRREAHPQAQWCEPPARWHAGTQNPHQALQQAGSSLPGNGLSSNRERGHQIQIDVKFLTFIDTSGTKTRRFQYTAIDPSRACFAYPAGQRMRHGSVP